MLEPFLQFGNGEEVGRHLDIESLVVHANDGLVPRLHIFHLHEVHRPESLYFIDVGDRESAV